MPPDYLKQLGQSLTMPQTGYLDSLKDAFTPKDSYLTTLGQRLGFLDDKAPNIFEQTQQIPIESQPRQVSTGIEEFLPGIKAIRESIEQKSLDPFKAHLTTLGRPAQTAEEIESLAFNMGLTAPIKTFGGLKNLSTKLLEKFKGMPDEITPQQFNEVINKATKEGIRKADLDLIKEMAERQVGKVADTILAQEARKSFITTDIQGNQVEQQFIRSGTKLEQKGGVAKSRGYNTIPDKTGYEKVYKPYGEQGSGYYYSKVIPKSEPKINLTKLAKDVETQLVPLTTTPVKSPRWSNVGQDFIGDGKYGEIVYQSPIKTSAGDVHYHQRMYSSEAARQTGQHMGPSYPNYFSHERHSEYKDHVDILETQSDLLQKENFAREFDLSNTVSGTGRSVLEDLNKQKEQLLHDIQLGGRRREYISRLNEIDKKIKNITKFGVDRPSEFQKLQPYSSNDPLAHLRTARESANYWLYDKGKDYMRFPRGETAMKIEGLGSVRSWGTMENGYLENVTPDMLKVGKQVTQNDSDWIITDILGEGKFKAVPKDTLEKAIEDAGIAADSIGVNDWISYARQHSPNVFDRTETFDISGKVDTKHFVYKLNEKEIPNDLRKQGYQVEADGTDWWKISKGERPKMPVEAFGALPLLDLDEDNANF